MSIPHRTIYRARRGGRLVPLAKSITPALRAFPPRKIYHARRGGRLFPIAIYGEGVADRPGVRSKASARDQNL